MTNHVALFRASLIVLLSCAGCSKDTPTGPTGPSVSFFVSSTTSATGNLGGLAAADATCRRLALTAGHSGSWRAYLSVERDPANNNQPTHARDRIGTGPWYNANLALVANNLTELHARSGDAAIFIDERAQRINGQWTGSPRPIEHDILTGSAPDGTLMAARTCADWTSDSAAMTAQVGHSDGMGPGQSTAGSLASWNSAHANGGCNNTAPAGGAGRLYCFARQTGAINPAAWRGLSIAPGFGAFTNAPRVFSPIRPGVLRADDARYGKDLFDWLVQATSDGMSCASSSVQDELNCQETWAIKYCPLRDVLVDLDGIHELPAVDASPTLVPNR